MTSEDHHGQNPMSGRRSASGGASGDVGKCPGDRATHRLPGEPGANSHLICKQYYPDAEAVACASFEDVFAAVENGDADLAMIPIDNSIAGRVADIHHFLPTSNLHIVAEHFLRIQFTLMGIDGRHARLDQDRAQPRARARPVPQGDPRARPDHRHLRRHRRRRPRDRRGPGPDPGRDRAAAGRRDLRPADPARGRRGRGPQHHPLRRPLPRVRRRPRADDGPVVTCFVFNVRNLPAALYKALGGFATNGVNMTKLESYMVGGEFTATQFLAEVDGHPEDVGVSNALEELALLHHRREDPRRLPGRPRRRA